MNTSLDIIRATKALSNPQFAFYSLAGKRIIALNEMIAYNTEDLKDDFGQLRKIGVNSRLVEIFQAMKIYTSMLEAYMDGSLLQPDLVKFCDQRNIIQHHVMSLPSANNLAGIKVITTSRRSGRSFCRY